MPEFTGTSEIKVFDLLTVIVMIEQCEPDLTVVTYWEGQPQRKREAHAFLKSLAPAQAPTQHTMCMACLLKVVTRFRNADGRADLIAAVKDGTINVQSIAPREDNWRCPRCQSHLIPSVISRRR